jgi:transposase
MPNGLVTMSAKEMDRSEVVRRVLERRLTQTKAAGLMGVSARQVRRMCGAYEREGAVGLISKRRGKPSNNRLSPDLQMRAVELVRQLYNDFGPTLASEKLLEVHGVRLSRETLRHWMADAGIWVTRDQRLRRPHQPRHRRECLGELVQIDGSPHAWFEERGPQCTLLVYVDDATGRLMELRFAKSESAFDYFTSTVTYLRRHGKPVAFYSDKHSIFRVYKEGTTGRTGGVTQFGRALTQLNIDIICANTPQAKGRVERMNQTLQDRLVKELRLRGISTMEAGNVFAPEFMDDYNRRFEREPRNPHDAHRPMSETEDLLQIFSWQEERAMSRNLVVHFKRVTYLVKPSPETIPLGGKRVQIREWDDGRVDIYCEGRALPYSVFDQNPLIKQGEIVENKGLSAVLSVLKVAQDERDRARLSSKKLTLREKDRIAAARSAAGRPAMPPSPPPTVFGVPSFGDRMGPVLSFFKTFEKRQKARTKAQNQAAALRRRAALAATAPTKRTSLLCSKPDISTLL